MTLKNPIFVLPQETDADARLAALEMELANCAQALDEGEVRSLNGVEKEVAILCEQVLQMPAGKAGPYIQQLQALADAFTALGEVMAAQRDSIRDELGELQARQKAMRAYGKQQVTAVKNAPDEEQE